MNRHPSRPSRQARNTDPEWPVNPLHQPDSPAGMVYGAAAGAALLLALGLALVLLSGCFASTVSVVKPEPISPEETALLKGFTPDQIGAYMRSRPATRFGFAGADGFEVVQRDVTLETDGKGGRKLTVHSGHRVDAEALAAVTKAAVEAAMKGAKAAVLPVP